MSQTAAMEADLSYAVRSALHQRISCVYEILVGEPPPVPDGTEEADPAAASTAMLGEVLHAVRRNLAPDRFWLLCVAVSGGFPTPDEVLEGLRVIELEPDITATMWLLDLALQPGAATAAIEQVRIVSDRVLVDVDYSARYDLHTGVQQVVRRTVSRWARDHEVIPVVWTDPLRGYRDLNPHELELLMRPLPHLAKQYESRAEPSVMVPWRTVVVMPETPARDVSERIVALAKYSGNALTLVGHDCIPAVSADLVPEEEPNRFAKYLTIAKHANRIAGVSLSAAAEFRGFANALQSQGLAGPVIVECLEPTEYMTEAQKAHLGRTLPFGDGRAPTVLCVGSLEPRKNHLALLYAAERLWRDGLDFRLLLIGGSAWGREVPDEIESLKARGRPIELRTKVSELEIATAYLQARFVVFPSLHEGYGLPAAESISFGTPVITSNYGSTAEIGALGGALLVDPRDDESLVDAIRLLLTDDLKLAQLRSEIAARPRRSWETFAGELWDALIEPDLHAFGHRAEG